MELTKKKIAEVAAIVAIVVIAGSIIGFRMHTAAVIAKESALVDELRAVRGSVELYYALNKTYPPDLKTLVTEKYTIGNRRSLYLTGIRVDKDYYPIDSFDKRFGYDPKEAKVWIDNKKYADW